MGVLTAAKRLRSDARRRSHGPRETLQRRTVRSPAQEIAGGQTSLKQLKKTNEAGIQKVKDSNAYKSEINRTYYPLLWIMLAYALLYMPTLTLTNSISFRNMSDPDKYFGSIRVLGTIGWIAAGLAVGFLLKATSPQPLYLAAFSSLALGVFCFALPKTPPSSESKDIGDMLGLPALAMLKSPAFVVFLVCSFLLMIPLAFYYAWANKFLTDINAPYPTALQTIGQVSEIFFMLAIPYCLKQFGTKGMLLIGMGAWVVRYAVFASMNVPSIVAIGLPLHGICYDFFFVVSYLYVDRKARNIYAQAQGRHHVHHTGRRAVFGELPERLGEGLLLSWRNDQVSGVLAGADGNGGRGDFALCFPLL